ncbi:uncharacterized protein LOC125675140 isoform X1 [Ostrea edulis]|uniref:uncharacterized protein LOC125675140 isoform X1 n=1 Tax=Ostrea edulis TaxID=37623 RepID=UPI0024AEB28B|nr:uncharacterized protein LOC125675140 isoform X1 [Ostrea edulis]XP_056014898.1 uncharacterized protein LOC125675140 isoform X1 [Ostrea edulis]XP_056014899.1 uncharacterized protein LOC125675140 isoform X1 [Ostrea edulis]
MKAWMACRLLVEHIQGSEEGSCSTISSCNATHMEVVERCPRSRQEWEEEAKLKNCDGIASPCRASNNLQYHCLINTWLNNTVSVCATPQFIIGYQCAEFNIRGSSIQPHWETDCSSFTPPCPFRYKSNKAFQYQECYELIKRDNTTLTSILSFVDITTGVQVSTDVDESRSITNVLWPVFVLAVGLVIASVAYFMYSKCCKVLRVRKGETLNSDQDDFEITEVLSHNLETPSE